MTTTVLLLLTHPAHLKLNIYQLLEAREDLQARNIEEHNSKGLKTKASV
jgi:hypothetical protein